MADSLRRLINIGTFSILQRKLEKWQEDYEINSCDQNVARCCEVIELNAKVQSQLFKLLSLTASEGGMYGNSGVIKSRLLPWLGRNFFTSGESITGDKSLDVLTKAADNYRKWDYLKDTYERSVLTFEDEIKSAQAENEDLKLELEEVKNELNQKFKSSTSEKMLSEAEIRDLKLKLSETQDELLRLKLRPYTPTFYDREIQTLKDELGYVRPYNKSYLSPSTNILSPDDPVQRVRQNNVVSRINDMFAQDRLDAMDTLRRYSVDTQNNQRIIFAIMQEAASVTRQAFRQFKGKVRTNIASTHRGPESLEESVQDYINRNIDLYDLPGMITDVIRGLNRNFHIFIPPYATYAILQPFIREACKLSWQMAALANPLDYALASDGELFDNNKYRRSYDSDFLAPLVSYHIWPCLMQGIKVLMKGEAVTKRNPSMTTTAYQSYSRSPARSPPLRARSRSPSANLRSRSLSPRRTYRSHSPFRAIRPL